MEHPPEPTYTVPVEHRKMENRHIIFWLLKDISWCLVWKVLGLLMILPTLAIAIRICWRTRDLKSELAHNLAIIFWIGANSYWMISEFFGFDEVRIWKSITGQQLALIPFTVGLLILARYYLIQKPRESKPVRVATR